MQPCYSADKSAVDHSGEAVQPGPSAVRTDMMPDNRSRPDMSESTPCAVDDVTSLISSDGCQPSEADTLLANDGMDPTLGLGMATSNLNAQSHGRDVSMHMVKNDKPSPFHLVGAIVAGLVLIAIPMALWVSPSLKSRVALRTQTNESLYDTLVPETDKAQEKQQVPAAEQLESGEPMDDPQAQLSRLSLGKVWISKCEKPGPGRTPPSQCDRQPWFEQALVRAVKENVSCAPKRSKQYSVSVVMRVDYRKRQVDLLAGKSGTLKGRAAQGLIKCLQRAVAKPDWEALGHEHTKYLVAVMATYDTQGGSEVETD